MGSAVDLLWCWGICREAQKGPLTSPMCARKDLEWGAPGLECRTVPSAEHVGVDVRVHHLRCDILSLLQLASISFWGLASGRTRVGRGRRSYHRSTISTVPKGVRDDPERLLFPLCVAFCTRIRNMRGQGRHPWIGLHSFICVMLSNSRPVARYCADGLDRYPRICAQEAEEAPGSRRTVAELSVVRGPEFVVFVDASGSSSEDPRTRLCSWQLAHLWFGVLLRITG